jgi:hypothetical protein
MNIRRIVFGLLGIAVVGAAFMAGIYAQRSRLPAGGFLQSTAAVIQLGVWDKGGVAKSNKATFIVTDPAGHKYKAESTEALNDWVYKSFPSEFSPYPENASVYTNYTWQCIVDGKVVAGGKFVWGNDRADDNNRNLR